MNHSYFIAAIASALEYSDTNDPAFSVIAQAIINDGEQRIYTDMDFLATNTSNQSLSFIANNRTLDLTPLLSLSTGPVITITGVNAISPAGLQAQLGTRNRIRMVKADILDLIWPIEEGVGTTNGIPAYGAMQDNKTLIVAPTPDQAYTAEVRGLYRPTPLSGSNPNTYISTTYPALMLSACMVFASGYQKNFGAASDDPKMAVSWESHYQALLTSAKEEEKRRKGENAGPSTTPPAPITAPPQG